MGGDIAGCTLEGIQSSCSVLGSPRRTKSFTEAVSEILSCIFIRYVDFAKAAPHIPKFVYICGFDSFANSRKLKMLLKPHRK